MPMHYEVSSDCGAFENRVTSFLSSQMHLRRCESSDTCTDSPMSGFGGFALASRHLSCHSSSILCACLLRWSSHLDCLCGSHQSVASLLLAEWLLVVDASNSGQLRYPSSSCNWLRLWSRHTVQAFLGIVSLRDTVSHALCTHALSVATICASTVSCLGIPSPMSSHAPRSDLVFSSDHSDCCLAELRSFWALLFNSDGSYLCGRWAVARLSCDILECVC